MSNVPLPISEKQLVAILRDHGVVDASIFGSFARGEARAESDLDLLVTYKPGTTLFDAIALQDELEQVLNRKVDLISKKSLSKRLAKRITNDLRTLSPTL